MQMKRINILVAAMLTLSLPSVMNAQQSQAQTSVQTIGAPESFKYQAIARNANGDAIANQPVSFRISIIEGSAEGTTVYSETQTSTTNQFGLANLSIGSGAVVSGVFNSINWENSNYFIKIEFDPKGGDNFITMGTSQMLSVPYSLYAQHSMMADSVKEFPIRTVLQGTNLQAPLHNPETGMLVYNTGSTGEAPYNVVPGYYYNSGTPLQPNWVLLMSSSTEDASSVKRLLSVTHNTSYGGVVKDGGTGSSVGSCGSGSNNTAFGDSAMNSSMTGNGNTGEGYITLLNLSTGYGNTANGVVAMNKNTSGNSNSATGDSVMFNNTTGSSNVADGHKALYSNTIANYNTAIGENAMQANTTAEYNTAVGYQALYSQNYSNGGTTWFSQNTAVGGLALHFNLPDSDIHAYHNTGIGYESFYENTTGYENSGLGMQSGISNTTGSRNTHAGCFAMYENRSGSSNTSIGYHSLYGAAANYSSSWNTAVGDSALYTTTTGDSNTAIGYAAKTVSGTITNATAIGYGADVCQSDNMHFGNSNVWGFAFGAAACPTSTKVFVVGSNSANGNGAYLAAGGVWTNASDRNKKENFTIIKSEDILSRINSLPILRWNYIGEPAAIQHIGPMAQDFYRIFQVGTDSISISTIDPAGVALAGIQALNKKLEEENAALKLQLNQVVTSQAKISVQQDERISANEKELAELKNMVKAMTQAQASIK